MGSEGPVTPAGREMADWFSTSNQLSERSQEPDYREAFLAAILAIEAEAVAAERARIVAAVKAHRCEGNDKVGYCTGKLHSTAAVLAIINGAS